MYVPNPPTLEEWLRQPADALSQQDVQWREEGGNWLAFYGTSRLVRCPQEGSQKKFVTSPIFETLAAGNRGGGKSDAAIMRYIQHVDRGFGADWVGLIIRNTSPELKDIIKKSEEIIPAIWPAAAYNMNEKMWTFPGGEKLYFRHLDREEQFQSYKGWEAPFVHFEELSHWLDDRCYRKAISICRCKNPAAPLMFSATTNPGGPGHNWIKRRFRLPLSPGTIVGPVIQETDEEGRNLKARVAISCSFADNQVLARANPDYLQGLKSAATSEHEKQAWVFGSWNIISGGMFDDLWDAKIHVLPDLDPRKLPGGWRIHRAYDHGQSKPFSVGWWATSNGEAIKIDGRTIGSVPGDVIRVFEWYGCGKNENEGLRMNAGDIALGIIEREIERGIRGRVRRGVADTNIFDDYQPGRSVAGDMARAGVSWYPADKGPGSRVQGWQQMRTFLTGAFPVVGGTREQPGLFVCERCVDFIRTVPSLPRDKNKVDDVQTDAEDHVGDETRYFLRMKHMQITQREF
jgi:hypothetical protein